MKHDRTPIFWLDLATAHYANVCNTWYEQNKVNIVPKELNPPNVPEVRQIERYWGIMNGRLIRSQKDAKTVKKFKNYQLAASKLQSKEAIRPVMAGIPYKAQKWGKQKLRT